MMALMRMPVQPAVSCEALITPQPTEAEGKRKDETQEVGAQLYANEEIIKKVEIVERIEEVKKAEKREYEQESAEKDEIPYQQEGAGGWGEEAQPAEQASADSSKESTTLAEIAHEDIGEAPLKTPY